MVHNRSDRRCPQLLSHRSLYLHFLQGALSGRRGISPFRIARILCRVAITCRRSRGWTVWNREIPSGIYSTCPPLTSFPVISSRQNATLAIRNRSAAYVPNGMAPEARMMENEPSSTMRSTIPTIPYLSEITRTSECAAGFHAVLLQEVMQVSRNGRKVGSRLGQTARTSLQIISGSRGFPR